MGVTKKLMELHNRQDASTKFVVQENDDGTISFGLTNTFGTAARRSGYLSKRNQNADA